MITLAVVFWLAAGLAVYTLVGYPLLSVVLASIVRREVRKGPITPKVTMIIAAYNEEEAIAKKLQDTLDLDYPADELEIIVASDGSTDRTDEIVQSFADRGVRLYRGPGRQGKTATLNGAVQQATGEILVFSDATGVYNRQSIRALAGNFNDPTIGCVTGRVTYRYGEDSTSKGFKFYQRFAVAVRMAETHFGSQTSVSGSIHAMRRELYRQANPAFSLDVINAMHTVAQGCRVAYEADATSLEESRTCLRDEFRCRIRISVRGTSMIPYVLKQLLRRGRLGYLFQFISHKLLRWWLWFLLAVMLLSSAALMPVSPVYVAAFVAQVLWYGLGLIGMLTIGRRHKIPGVSSVAFFVMANAAMCVGAVKALAGGRMPKWEPVR